MAAQDGHQAIDPTRFSISTLPRLVEEANLVDRAIKRLSLTPASNCDNCGQQVPLYCSHCGQRLLASTKSFTRNSSQTIKLSDCTPVCSKSPPDAGEDDGTPRRGLRFWCIMFSLIVVGMISALETTIVGTALPTIVSELGGAEWYIWCVNGYLLTR